MIIFSEFVVKLINSKMRQNIFEKLLQCYPRRMPRTPPPKTAKRMPQENIMGPHGSPPKGSNQSMASGLNRFEEEKDKKLGREISQTSQVSK